MRWRRRVPALGIAVCLAAGLSAFGAVSIDPEELAGPIHTLTSAEFDGRGTGSAGGERAARWIAGEFARIGLRPLGVSDPNAAGAAPDGSGWFQPFLITVGATLGSGNALSARVSGRTIAYALERDFVPSTLSGSGPIAGPVSFGGYGIVSRAAGRDDYGGRDVRGRVVLLLAGAPTDDPKSPLSTFAGIYHKVIYARDRGASAVVVASADDSEPAGWNTNRGFSDEGLPVLLVPRRVAAAWLGADGWTIDAVADKLAQGPWPLNLSVALTGSTEVQKERRPTANVAGLLPGSDASKAGEFVVIGAHFDHLGEGGPTSRAADRRPAIHPGADDNASGTAGLLALARHLAAGPRPRRSILFLAFSGEELGLLGSAHYVRHPLVPLAATVAMLNMDMIGRLRDDRLAVIGTGSSPEFEGLLREESRGSGFRLELTEEAFGASDQQSFYLGGVPVLFFFTGQHAEYHTPADVESTINRPGEARVLDLVARCAERIADDPSRPAFRALDLPPPPGSRVALGIIPDAASDDGSGVSIAETSASGAARKAGLERGDVIVRLGAHTVVSVHDLHIALSELAPGAVVDGVVRRGGRNISFSAILPGAGAGSSP